MPVHLTFPFPPLISSRPPGSGLAHPTCVWVSEVYISLYASRSQVWQVHSALRTCLGVACHPEDAASCFLYIKQEEDAQAMGCKRGSEGSERAAIK